MSIKKPGEHAELLCLICDNRILDDELLIRWSGNLLNGPDREVCGAINLHVECARIMAAGVMRDVLEARVGLAKADAWYKTYRRQPRTLAP
jgi:hypothetical protein